MLEEGRIGCWRRVGLGVGGGWGWVLEEGRVGCWRRVGLGVGGG